MNPDHIICSAMEITFLTVTQGKISCIFEQSHWAKVTGFQDWNIVLLLQTDFSPTFLFTEVFVSHQVPCSFCLLLTALLLVCNFFCKSISKSFFLPSTIVFCYLLGCRVYCSVHCFFSVLISLEGGCWSAVETGGQGCQVQCFPFHLSGQNSFLNNFLCLISISLYKKSTGCVMIKTWMCA